MTLIDHREQFTQHKKIFFKSCILFSKEKELVEQEKQRAQRD